MSHGLRNFKKEDVDGVRDLILSILAREYPFDKSAYSDSDLYKIAEVYGGARDVFYVVEEDGRIVGTVGVKEDGPEEALLRRLFVDADHRRHGYGQALIAKALGFCREQGYKKVCFRCTDRMADAMRLCMKNGFKDAESLMVSGFKIHRLELVL